MPLFGPPNIEQLIAKHDIRGLIKALDYQKDKNVRKSAAQALGELKDTSAVEPLISVLKDKDEFVRGAAIQALSGLKDALPALVHCLGFSADAPKDIGPAALEAIRIMGDTDGLLQLLHAGDPENRCGAAFALGRLRLQQAVEPLILILGDIHGDQMLRVVASNSLADLGDNRAVEPLISVLGELGEIGVASANALGRIGDPRGLMPVINYFVDSIRSFDMKGYHPTPMLINKLLEQDIFRSKISAIMAFGQTAIDPLGNMLEHESDEKVRIAIEYVFQQVKTHKPETKMSISMDEIQAKLVSLSVMNQRSQDVKEEVKKLINMCQSEEDKKLVITLCRSLGLDYDG
jgi:HEAT repeat protein